MLVRVCFFVASDGFVVGCAIVVVSVGAIVVALCRSGVIDVLLACCLCLFDIAVDVVIGVALFVVVMLLLLCYGLGLVLSFLFLQLLYCY